jgi:hypothetical protein
MSVAFDQGHAHSGRAILNHDIMHCTADGIAGNHLYSGRALAISERWDMIQLHPDLEPLWPEICAHYRQIGLPHTNDVIWHVHPEELGEHIGYRPSVFYFGPDQYRFWGDSDWLEAVEFINSKNHFIALAEELGVDVPRTRCFDRADEVGSGDIARMGYPCYIKAAVSVAGVGIHRCEDPAGLREALRGFDPATPVQLQEEVRASAFLNLQYRVAGKQLFRLAASEQILDGFAHQGNRVPAAHAPWEAVEPMACWLHERGIKGIFAFDVAVTQTARGLRFPAIECNPRFNGASYPTLVAQRLGVGAWSARTFSTRHRSLEAIDLEGIEFDPRTKSGVVLVNWGPVLVGKLLVMFAGTPMQQQRQQAELVQRL